PDNEMGCLIRQLRLTRGIDDRGEARSWTKPDVPRLGSSSDHSIPEGLALQRLATVLEELPEGGFRSRVEIHRRELDTRGRRRLARASRECRQELVDSTAEILGVRRDIGDVVSLVLSRRDHSIEVGSRM